MGIKEIAKRAKVSIATVDRVIHDRPGVALKTKQRILHIIREIDYQPNILASRLKSKKNYTLAVLIPKITAKNNFWEAPYQGIVKALQEVERYGIRIKSYRYDKTVKNSFKQSAIRILEDHADGILMAPFFANEAHKVVKSFTQAGIPYLFIDSYLHDNGCISYIGPNLYHSGFVAGQLAKYVVRSKEDVILTLNITNTNSNRENLKEIARGFANYFGEEKIPNPLQTIDIVQEDYPFIRHKLARYFEAHPTTSCIFVTNARVYSVARFLKETQRQSIVLIGFDFISENIRYLKENVIDFLICHKPEEQGYRGIKSLYKHLILRQEVEEIQFMPIDIITKENMNFYRN